MPTVTYYKEGNIRGRVTLGVEYGGEARSYSVTSALYASLSSPVRGTELSTYEYGLILECDESYRCMKKALSLLSYADNNKRTLYIKLVRHGFSRRSAEEAVRECVALGYIDECRQLERLVLRFANVSLRGGSYIRSKLVSQGYSPSDVDSVISRLENSGEIDFSQSFLQLMKKKGAKTDEEIKKLKYKYGF